MQKSPIMLLFFNRPECLSQVFDSIKKYQPPILFLVQDGPRKDNDTDIENISRCRDLVSDDKIDWNCKVYRNYADVNMTCDHREFTGISWCFEYVDQLIILEDDCVPTQGFYKLCDECLERYKENTAIHSIYGFNRVGIYDCPYDYLFSMTGAGIGWATWKRVWEQAEKYKDLLVLDDKTAVDYLDKTVDNSIKKIYGDFTSYMTQTKIDNEKSGRVTSWEKILGFVQITNNMLSITPKYNMIKYIGICDNATHSPNDPNLIPHKVRNVLMQEAFDITGEINHPPFIIRDTEFEVLSSKSMRYLPGMARIESFILRLKYRGFIQTIQYYITKMKTL